MADIIDPTRVRDDLATTMTQSLSKSGAETMNVLNATTKQIEDANAGYARTVQDSTGITNSVYPDILDAINTKKDLAETPKIVKSVMSILGFDRFNENIQNLRIQEGNAKLGIAEKRLEAGREAHRIAISSAKNMGETALQTHSLKRQSVFDAFAVSANISEEQKRQLEGVDDTTLAGWKKNPGSAPEFIASRPGLIDAEGRRRKGQQLGLESQGMQVEAQSIALKDKRRDEALMRLTNDDVMAIASGKMALPAGVEKGHAEKELQNRQAAMLSLDAARRAAKVGDMQIAELHIDSAMKNYSSTQLKYMSEQAKAKGGQIELNGVPITEARLSAMALTKQKAEQTMIKDAVNTMAENAAIEAKLNVATTKAGNISNMYPDKQMPAEMQAKVQELVTKIKVAEASGSLPAKSDQVKALDEFISKESEKLIKDLPKSEQGAGKEYLESSQVRKPENAFNILGTSLSNSALLGDHTILAPIWRDVSEHVQNEKNAVTQGMTLGALTERGLGNININQPKKAQDDELVQNALKNTKADQKFGNSLYQRALANALSKMHEKARMSGSDSPYGQFVNNVNGVPELSRDLYSEVPIDPANPNGARRRVFNSTRIWEQLAAFSVRDTALGKLSQGSTYAGDLVDFLRSDLPDFEKSVTPELHNSMYASALTNMITGGNIRGMLVSRFNVDEQYASQAYDYSTQIDQQMKQTSRAIPKNKEEAELMAERNLYPFDPKNLIQPIAKQDEAIRRSFPTVRDKGSLQDMINILRQSSMVTPSAQAPEE